MIYEIVENKIKIFSLDEFNPIHIFECGQVFAYKKINENCYVFYPNDKVYLIYKEDEFFYIQQIGGKINWKETIKLFDLDTNYDEIKNKIGKLINKDEFGLDRLTIKNALSFGSGIRILKQDCFETIISFVFSQNNNIKRIKNSLNTLREKLGKEIAINIKVIENEDYIELLKKEKFYSFPTLKELIKIDEEFFSGLGAGYRAKYLIDLIKQLNENNKDIICCFQNDKNEKIAKMEFIKTENLRNNLIKLKGIGRKVADCILLFGFGRKDVFPVDIWICHVYKDLICNNCNISAIKISDILEKEFKELSGYIQQYLFYYKRNNQK